MVEREYQICTRCIMDTTDPEIEFDENGVCNHCRKHEAVLAGLDMPAEEREAALNKLVDEIKAKGKGKDYDCVIGVSGGVDSTYVAYMVKEKLGLRPLAVHLDNGWDSELAVSNIEKVLKKLDIDLYTHVLDWEEFKDLQLAFLKASTSDSEVPTDHVIRAVLYEAALRENVSYVILGNNNATEGILPKTWTYGTDDWRYISGLYRRFGKNRRLKHFPHFSYWDMFRILVLRGIKDVLILDYIDYTKEEALAFLKDKLEWRPYGGKHYESIYTRFFQGYILPNKFNIDKRRAHLSTLIVSGQITREEALAEIADPPYSGYMLEEDLEFVLKKFELTEEGFNQIMTAEPKTHWDYPSNARLRRFIKSLNIPKMARKLGIEPKI